MILNTLVVFTSEIKIYINNKKFKWLNLILIILASFLVIFSLPYSEIIKTKNPLNGIIFTNFLIVIFSYYNLKSINGGIKIQNSMTGFEWKKNKGYPTKTHREAIKQFGITNHHRKTFQLLPKQYKLEL